MDKDSKTKSDEQVGYSTLLAGAKRCHRCGKTVFYRVTIGGESYNVHGDKSTCPLLSFEL